MAGKSTHRHDQKSWWPEPDEYAAAKDVLQNRGYNMTAYLRACVRWLDAEPDAALATLAAHWPPPRPRGRPFLVDEADTAGPRPNGAASARPEPPT